MTPLNSSVPASATRSPRSGTRTVNWLAIKTPGIEPTSSEPIAARSTLPWARCASAGNPQQRGRMEDVRAHDLRGRQREDEQHHEREERPAADRRQPDDEPSGRAQREGDQVLPATEQERRVVRLDAAADEGLGEEAEAAEHERRADDDPRERVDVAAVAVLQPLRDLDADQRQRRRAGEHPERQARVHRARGGGAARRRRS